LFSNVGKKVCFILIYGFCNFGRCKPKKKTRIIGEEGQASTKLAIGMTGEGGEGGMEDAKARANEC